MSTSTQLYFLENSAAVSSLVSAISAGVLPQSLAISPICGVITGIFAAESKSSGSAEMQFKASASSTREHFACSSTDFTRAQVSSLCPSPQPMSTAEASSAAGSKSSAASAEIPPSAFAGRGRKVASGTIGAIRLCTLSVQAILTMPAPIRRAPVALIAAAPGRLALPVMQSSFPKVPLWLMRGRLRIEEKTISSLAQKQV